MLSLIPGWDALNGAMTARGLTLADLPARLWPGNRRAARVAAGRCRSSVVLASDVRDAGKARAFVDILTSGQLGGEAWRKTEHSGITLFSPLTEGPEEMSPALALTEQFALVGLNTDTVVKALAQVQEGHARLDSIPAYTTAAKSITAPTSGFAYLDLPTLFERGYAVLKPLLAMSLAFSPDAGRYVDLGQLPPAETISKHLGPIVYSQSNTDRGTLIESTGPITLNQLALGVTAGAVGAILPTVQSALSSGALLDPNQLFKSLSSPTPIPSTVPPAPPANSPIEAPGSQNGD